MDHPLADATAALLTGLDARTLNGLAEQTDFELPVSGDDLAIALADRAGRVL